MESVISEIETNHTKAPNEFDFPFTPYSIQHEFMSKLYEVIERKQFGIFESPTGTGKSLSIICGAIRWLRDYNKRLHESYKQKINNLENEAARSSKDSSEVDDWFNAKSREIELTRMLHALKLEYKKLQEYDIKIEKLKTEKEVQERKKTWKKNHKKILDEAKPDVDLYSESIEDDLILDEQNERLDFQSDEDNEFEDEKYEPIKIYICSRTHSQLSQFVGEIIKSPFGKDTRAITLASRQSYCINPAVKKLKNLSLINERCLDIQKNNKKLNKADKDGKVIKKQRSSVSCCPYYKQQNIEYLKDSALLEVQDVEDLVSSGKEIGACPYYASRKAAEDAQVVLVPYNTLFHKATREANGIKLKNNIVIIDEAHNLLEALAQMYSSNVTYCQLHYAYTQLVSYKSKYSTRFSYSNLLCINQLIFIVKKLLSLFDKTSNKKNTDTEIYIVRDFVLQADIDNYNMFKLLKFCNDSKIAQKLYSFVVKFPDLEEEQSTAAKGVKEFIASIQNKSKNTKQEPVVIDVLPTKKETPSNPLLAVISFLESLTYTYDDGRVLVQNTENKSQSKLQFLLLNPAIHFAQIVKDARSVIVAGGTMKPNAEFRDRLFKMAGAESQRIVEFSCDHIISPENILPIVLTHGPQKQPLLFNFENRLSLGNTLKIIIIEACKKVRGGIVVFFPSYKYESWFWQQVQETEFKRPVFREPQDSASVEVVLKAYADNIKKSKDALLFSVVGGKLSEGLNFSDDLGRCVIVVGLPYANIKSAELKEKMTYLDKKEGFGAGHKFYEGLCLKAVNQCIGRAVRHKNDYATMILLDERYNRAATKTALPEWIKRSLKVCDYEQCFQLISKFFQDKKST